MITNYFRFHPVGQGGFYSGHLNYDFLPRRNNSCDFVFDCGTISMKNEFKDFVERIKRNFISDNTLDILFISHLDDDHVNGIKFLIPNIRCEKIYLPYLTPLERLYVLMRHRADMDNYEDFVEFIVNPSRYLNSIDGADIGEINYITGNSEGLSDNNRSEIPVNPDDFNGKISDNLKIDENDSNEEMSILRSDPQQKVVFKKANRKLIYGDIWEFFLYHIKADPTNVDKFIHELNKLYDIQVGADLSLSDLEEIVEDKKKLKTLREKFKEYFRNLNKTGLIVQHKPINYEKMDFNKATFINYPYNYFYSHSNINYFTVDNYGHSYNHGVTLLTGDIDFKGLESSDYIKSHLTSCQVFQVSHHGSANGWTNAFLFDLKRANATAVINFGFGNTYGHPRPEVLKDLNDADLEVRFCNQFAAYDYRIVLNSHR